jgi:hypothetical protein
MPEEMTHNHFNLQNDIVIPVTAFLADIRQSTPTQRKRKIITDSDSEDETPVNPKVEETKEAVESRKGQLAYPSNPLKYKYLIHKEPSMDVHSNHFDNSRVEYSVESG